MVHSVSVKLCDPLRTCAIPERLKGVFSTRHYTNARLSLPLSNPDLGCRRGVAVECRTHDQEVAGSSLGRTLRRKNSGQVSHTYVPLSPSSITWYWPKGGDA